MRRFIGKKKNQRIMQIALHGISSAAGRLIMTGNAIRPK
jgi:hypothetical protein